MLPIARERGTVDAWCGAILQWSKGASDEILRLRIGKSELEKESPMSEAVNNPAHYGGADNPYEAIKVIEAWGLGFRLGNTAKYISRIGKKGDTLENLKKARWYLDREIQILEEQLADNAAAIERM